VAFYREAGFVYLIVVWPDEDEGRREYPTRRDARGQELRDERGRPVDPRPWWHCPVPSRKGETSELRATIIPLTEQEALEFSSRIVGAGKCFAYASRAEAQAAHPDVDFSQMGSILGIPV